MMEKSLVTPSYPFYIHSKLLPSRNPIKPKELSPNHSVTLVHLGPRFPLFI